MKIKAAVLYRLNSPLVIEELEIPAPKAGQILVKILYSGVCRAQVNEQSGLKGPDRFLPHLLGHEASAIVVKTGPKVTKVKQGDYVCLSWIKGNGKEVAATQYKKGKTIINAGAVTTFSNYAIVAENRATKIPKTIPPEVVAILGCAVATGAGIINNILNVKPKSSVAVFGIGGIGGSAILAAKRRGCKKIIAVDINQKKLAFASKLGATHRIKAGPQTLELIRQIVERGTDYAVEASGSRTAMETAFDAVHSRGMIAIAGNLKKDEKISIHPFELIKGKRIVGTWGGETHPEPDFLHYARDYQRGRFPIHKLITHRLKLKDINKAMTLLKRGEAGRIVIQCS